MMHVMSDASAPWHRLHNSFLRQVQHCSACSGSPARLFLIVDHHHSCRLHTEPDSMQVTSTRMIRCAADALVALDPFAHILMLLHV
jgi:hypothetical protein